MQYIDNDNRLFSVYVNGIRQGDYTGLGTAIDRIREYAMNGARCMIQVKASEDSNDCLFFTRESRITGIRIEGNDYRPMSRVGSGDEFYYKEKLHIMVGWHENFNAVSLQDGKTVTIPFDDIVNRCKLSLRL